MDDQERLDRIRHGIVLAEGHDRELDGRKMLEDMAWLVEAAVQAMTRHWRLECKYRKVEQERDAGCVTKVALRERVAELEKEISAMEIVSEERRERSKGAEQRAAGLEKDPLADAWVVWCDDLQGWWRLRGERLRGGGHSEHLGQAGVYSKAEAVKYANSTRNKAKGLREQLRIHTLGDCGTTERGTVADLLCGREEPTCEAAE